MAPGATLLAALAPAAPYFPDFLTPPEASRGLTEGLAALFATPRVELRAQLTRLDAVAPVPEWVRPLADGDRDLLTEITAALARYHDAMLGPCFELVQGAIDADRSLRAQQFLTGGIEAMLAGIGPVARWRRPVLEVEHAVDQDLYLEGRGLRLVPSFFCGRTACTLADPALPPVLIYPIDASCRWTQAGNNGRSLKVLIGATRAAVLAAIGTGTTTTRLARCVGTSPASASRHTTVLRDCGLITTRREGMAVMHNLTPLGEALLEHHRNL
ncbi:winged helix-turn-helix domain-containing protein [Amycolatopsis sp. NPDC051371]|uniref:ArsR/SmtB family transcription factor n=1 Tax=Amycolatopsis sp. NPDC051371 TaxID=3155800 RepID=UPI0034180ADC